MKLAIKNQSRTEKKYLFFALILTLLCGCETRVANLDSQGTTIVCFGDSLTAGFGAEAGKDYPSFLRKMVDLPVINAGAKGDTTTTALARLNRDVMQQNPRIVIITLGGNDFLRRLPKAETLANTETIIDRIHEGGAMVVWAGVKTGLFGDAYAGELKRIARKKEIVLIPDILQGILFDPRYKYDQIHPNSEGYRIMAERIKKTIDPLLREKAN